MRRFTLVVIGLLVAAACSSDPRPDRKAPGDAALSVLYSIRVGDPELLIGAFRAPVPAGPRVSLDARSFDGAFYGSPDGRFVLRRTPYELTADARSELAVAPSNEIAGFEVIATVRGAYVEEVLWSPDGGTIFYLASVSRGGGTLHELRSVRRDGSDATTITRFFARTPVDLTAVDVTRGVLFWTDEYWSDDASTDGHRTHITEVDLVHGTSKRIDVTVAPVPGPDMAFAPDGSAVYYLAGARIVERVLSTGVERILYRSADLQVVPHGILVSPDGTTLYFEEQDWSSEPKATIFRLSIRDTESTVIARYRPVDEIGPVRLSPDGSWMWLGNGSQHRLLDLRTGNTRTFLDGGAARGRLEFLSWVVA